MTKLEKLEGQVEEARSQALMDSAFGSRELQLQYQAQINAYHIVLRMIAKLEPLCQRCGGRVLGTYGEYKCINCGASHDDEGDLIPTIDGKNVKPSNAEATKG